MKKIYATVIFITLLLIPCLYSCANLEIIKGSGNIVSKDYNVSGYNAIKTSDGIEVMVLQNGKEGVRIETDDNLQQLVNVEVDGRELKISRERSFLVRGKIKAFVSVKYLEKVDVSSGAHISTDNQITTDIMKIEVSSGAEVNMDITTKYLTGSASSGSHINLKGNCQVVDFEASSGAGIDAENLITETAKAETSSGAHVNVSVKEEIIAEASSGGQIKVIGNPASRKIHKSSGGNVDFQ